MKMQSRSLLFCVRGCFARHFRRQILYFWGIYLLRFVIYICTSWRDIETGLPLEIYQTLNLLPVFPQRWGCFGLSFVTG
jgi:hypothetical protein